MNFSRRDFIVAGASAGMMAAGNAAFGEVLGPEVRKLKGFAPLNVKRIFVEVGAERPFKVVHLSDTHIVRAVKSDGYAKIRLAAARYGQMGYGEHYLWEAVAMARADGAMLVHTGDMIDFVSKANLDFAGLAFGTDDWFVAAGNHEYSRFVGEAREDAEYKAGSYDRVFGHYPNDLTFASRIVNGVNFVAADDVYYNFTEEQLRLMKKEVEKGLPIVFLCHVPLHVPKHYEHMMQVTHGLCAYETGVPDNLVKTWKGGVVDPSNWRDRRVQQRTDGPTAEFIAYLKSQPLVKAVLCGHCHEFWEERFSPTAMMYVADATYHGGCTEIKFT
jgi:hypothetical protein